MRKVLLLICLMVAPWSAAWKARAQQSYPEVHDDPIRIRILTGTEGAPVPHLPVLLLAGYERNDLRKGLWQEEAATDDEGNLQVPSSLVNFPWLRIVPAKGIKPCLSKPSERVFSMERIRLDGLSAPNSCGPIALEDRPGTFNFFVAEGLQMLPGQSANHDSRGMDGAGAKEADRTKKQGRARGRLIAPALQTSRLANVEPCKRQALQTSSLTNLEQHSRQCWRTVVLQPNLLRSEFTLGELGRRFRIVSGG